MLESGHYAGATSPGDPFSFDVTETGEVTNVIAGVDGAVLSISERFSVDETGCWQGGAAGRGVSTTISGRVGSEHAEGTIEAELVVAGLCRITGPVSWRARRIHGLAY